MRQFTYYAESGAIKLGNEDFSINIPNNYGDGDHTVYVIETGEIDTFGMVNRADVRGKFAVYRYDCDYSEKLIELNGHYGIFVKGGTVVIEKFAF